MSNPQVESYEPLEDKVKFAQTVTNISLANGVGKLAADNARAASRAALKVHTFSCSGIVGAASAKPDNEIANNATACLC